MINKWSVKNFKSIKKTLIATEEKIQEGSLDIAPLTIFCGVNSSGKSSLIQSILLVAQSMIYNDENTPVVLNGPLVKLGSYENIFNCDDYDPEKSGDWPDYWMNSTIEINYSCKFKQLDVFFTDSDYPFEKIENFNKAEGEEILQTISFTVDDKDDSYFKEFFDDETFFPILTSNTKMNINFNNGYSLANKMMTKSTGKELEALFEDIELIKKHGGNLFEKNSYLEYLSIGEKNYINPGVSFSPNNIFCPIKRNNNDNLQKVNDKKLNEIINEYSTYLTSKIIYVGPLRHDPRKPYPVFSNENNVGVDGEYTALILIRKGKQFIPYLPSKCFTDNTIRLTQESILPRIEEAPLKEAINDWLAFFGIANTVMVENSKHGLAIVANGRNIDSVGVGVSQLLPIITACLSADKGSTLIFEQPELHLHPKLQSKLADFFLSISLTGKQCIIETHSEYIIDKLRYRVADAPKIESLSDTIKIYFTSILENDIDIFIKGTSIFTPVEINEFGVMTEWPEDFFDESAKISNAIIKAAARKNDENGELEDE